MVTFFLRIHYPCPGTEEIMGTKLERIAEISATTPKPEFTSLYHLINAEMLTQCHKELDGKKAVGIDKVTKAEYDVHGEGCSTTRLVEVADQIIKDAKIIYQNVWIVFDKDDFDDFDQAIQEASRISESVLRVRKTFNG